MKFSKTWIVPACLGILVAGLALSCQSAANKGTTSAAASAGSSLTVTPGKIEDKGNAAMAKVAAAHEAVKPGPDDVVIYYYRPDGKYDDWGFWLWNYPGGDGNSVWKKSKDLSVSNGIGYFRFKKDGSDVGVNLVGEGTMIGVIPRKDSDWIKDGDQDRIIPAGASNEWVIFSGDQKTYPYGPYVPSFENASFTAKNTIYLELSGKQALTLEPSSNGFVVQTLDGSKTYAIADVTNDLSPNDRSDNYTRKIDIKLAEDVDISNPVQVTHPKYFTPITVSSSQLAAKLAEDYLPPTDYQLGPIYDAASKSVEFRLWSPFASKVSVRLYKQSGAAKADYSMDLSKTAATGVWTGVFKDQDPDGLFYEYSVFQGISEKIVLDPYAPSMDAYKGSGAGRGAIINPAKAIPAGGWTSGSDVQLAKREDAVIYEMSVRDFTISPDSGVKAKPGTYLAFIEKIPYLKSLGVTHVQLMPVMNFMYNDETNQKYEASGTANNNNYDWGYDPQSYFTPEGWYASNPSDPYARVVELKTLIRELHKAGIGVILDAVYNHTGNISVLNDIVPGYYYRLNAQGKPTSNSGCGNDVASERAMARKLIVDSTKMWVSDYHVDGFRFDLMGLIDAKTLLQARAACAAVPDKSDVLFEGEGWKMYSGPRQDMGDQNYVTKTDVLSVFNDEFRNLVKAGGMDDKAKGFITGKPTNTSLLFDNLMGRPGVNYSTDQPGDSMNYTEAHDNLTMHDNVSYNAALSDSDPTQRQELIQRLRLGNFLVLTGEPIAFLHGGQEEGRTKPKINATGELVGNFVHNSYDSADNINQFDWKPAADYQALRDYTAGLIAIRRANEAFRIGDAAKIETAGRQIPQDDKLGLGWAVTWNGKTFYMFVNANVDAPLDFDTGDALDGYKTLVDDDEANAAGVKKPSGFEVSGSTVTVEPLTAVMIVK